MANVQKILGVSFLSLSLFGCTVGPDFKTPKSPTTNSFTAVSLPDKTVSIKSAPEKTQKLLVAQEISHQWWALFQSDALNQLVERGLKNSPTLQAAQASLRQAEANLKSETSGFFPFVDAQIGAKRQKQSKAPLGVKGPATTFNLYNASVDVSYSPDIFGALRRQAEAAEAQVDFQRFELEAAYLTLTSNIVTTAIQEGSLRAQIQVTKELLASQEKQLKILKGQFSLGGISQTDIFSQETLVAQTMASLPTLESALAQTRHALAILVGDLPSEANLPVFNLTDIRLPQEVPVTLPSTLVQNRPDIKAAEALLHQANAEIGVAKAHMFPQIMITGSKGFISNSTHKLFAGSSDVWNIGSNLLQPIFQGGALMARKDAAMAAYDAAFAHYRQTVLQSFQQVADVLTVLVEGAKTHKALDAAEKSALRALDLSRKQHQMGAISFLVLLNSEHQYQQTRIGRIQAEAARYTNTAALFQALGGDCFAQRSQPPQKEQSEISRIKDSPSS